MSKPDSTVELADALLTMHRYVTGVFEATGQIALNTAVIYQDKNDVVNSDEEDIVLSVAAGMFDSDNEIAGKLFTSGVAFSRIAVEDAHEARTPILVLAAAALTFPENDTVENAKKVVIFCAYHTEDKMYSAIECDVVFSESGKEAVKISEFSREDFSNSVLTKKRSELGDLEKVLHPLVLGYENAIKNRDLWNMATAINVDGENLSEEFEAMLNDKSNLLHDDYKTVRKLAEASREAKKERLSPFEKFIDSLDEDNNGSLD